MSPFTSVAFVARSEIRFLMLAMIRELKNRHGSRIHLFCFGPQEVAFYEEQNADGLFESIDDAEVLLSSTKAENLDEAEVIERGRTIEKALPRNYNSIVVGNRHLGRGYALGGFFHPRSRYSEETDYVHLVHAYNETFSFWEDHLTKYGITLVINGTMECAVVSRKLKIPFRVMAPSRHKSLHFWAVNEFYEDPRVAARFELMRDQRIAPVDDAQPYHTHVVSRTAFIKKGARFRDLIRNVGDRILRHMYWRLRGYAKAKSYYLGSELTLFYKIWSQFRQLQGLTQPLSALDGKKFVYFPLHLEPEAALQILSPEYFFQLSTVAALSRDLPVGVMLAVKETFAGVGRRPDNFYRQLADLKNVVFLDTMELGLEVAKRASVVATINGTGGMEAALEGKPVIVFGKHNVYECMPHVRRVDDHALLREALEACLEDPGDPETNKAYGRSYLQTVKDLSFDLCGFDFVNLKDFEPQVPVNALNGLEASFEEAEPSTDGASESSNAGAQNAVA